MKLQKEAFRIAKDERAPAHVKESINRAMERIREIGTDYADQLKNMDKAQAYYTRSTEATSMLLGELLGEQYVIDTLAERNESLVKQLINRFKGTIKKSATVNSESVKYLRKLVSKFEKAIDNAHGGVSIKSLGGTDEEKQDASKFGNGNSAEYSDKFGNTGVNENVEVENERRSLSQNNVSANFIEDKYFRSQISKWQSLKHGAFIKVGIIKKGHPLNLVGMPDGALNYDVDKLNKNMGEHSDYLNVNLLNSIPDIIANPIAISEYKEENTVSVFGDVFVGSSPMMVGVVISKNKAGNSISKVRTFNARKDVGNLITDEKILYLNENKKRTQQWFQACGIQVPLGETKFGFIRSISQNNKKSNTFDKKIDDERKSISKSVDSDGNSLSLEQAEYFKDSKVRDENGNLLVVYHGSEAVFNEFKHRYINTHGSQEGRGFYFTDSVNMARGYERGGGQLLKGYVNISKPLSDTELTLTRKEVASLIKAIDPTGDDLIANYDTGGGMGYPSRAWYNRAFNDTLDAVMNYCDTDSEVLAELRNAGADEEKLLKTVRRTLGYDGYITSEKYENAQIFVAFESNQFKNADNTAPTDNPDIRYSKSKSERFTIARETEMRLAEELVKLYDEGTLSASEAQRKLKVLGYQTGITADNALEVLDKLIPGLREYATSERAAYRAWQKREDKAIIEDSKRLYVDNSHEEELINRALEEVNGNNNSSATQNGTSKAPSPTREGEKAASKGDEYFIEKLANRNLPLVEKIFKGLKQLVKKNTSSTASGSPSPTGEGSKKSAAVDKASAKYLNKLVNKFGKAIDNAKGGVKISQIGTGDEEKKTAENIDFVDEKRYNKKGNQTSRKTNVNSNRSIWFLHKNFPSENEVQSEAHRLAVWWARRVDVEAGDQTLISMNDNWYLVEKFDDADNYYQVEDLVTKVEFEVIFEEIKKNGNIGKIKSILSTTNGYDSYNRQHYPFDEGESGSIDSKIKHRSQGSKMVRLDSNETKGRERPASYRSGDSESSGKNRQGYRTVIDDERKSISKSADVTQSKQFIRFFGDWQNNPQDASKVVNGDRGRFPVSHKQK